MVLVDVEYGRHRRQRGDEPFELSQRKVGAGKDQVEGLIEGVPLGQRKEGRRAAEAPLPVTTRKGQQRPLMVEACCECVGEGGVGANLPGLDVEDAHRSWRGAMV